MSLNSFAADQRVRIFEALKVGQPPLEGVFDESLWKECHAKGEPQMGSTVYKPWTIHYEFIYPEAGASTTIFTVQTKPPERIVFMPVPAWVIESIWQGEVTGSHHFESDATKLVMAFQAQLEESPNAVLFGPQPPRRRE
jgi:hypothetical protein